MYGNMSLCKILGQAHKCWQEALFVCVPIWTVQKHAQRICLSFTEIKGNAPVINSELIQ